MSKNPFPPDGGSPLSSPRLKPGASRGHSVTPLHHDARDDGVPIVAGERPGCSVEWVLGEAEALTEDHRRPRGQVTPGSCRDHAPIGDPSTV